MTEGMRKAPLAGRFLLMVTGSGGGLLFGCGVLLLRLGDSGLCRQGHGHVGQLHAVDVVENHIFHKGLKGGLALDRHDGLFALLVHLPPIGQTDDVVYVLLLDGELVKPAHVGKQVDDTLKGFHGLLACGGEGFVLAVKSGGGLHHHRGEVEKEAGIGSPLALVGEVRSPEVDRLHNGLALVGGVVSGGHFTDAGDQQGLDGVSGGVHGIPFLALMGFPLFQPWLLLYGGRPALMRTGCPY